MKKMYIILMLLGVISSPVDINRKINIYEDREIIEKYGEYLEGIDIEDYSPSIKKTDLIIDISGFNNNTINYNDLEIKHVLSPINILENFEYDDKKLSKLLINNFSKNLEQKIKENILEVSKKNNLISNIFIEKNSDLEKLEEFKSELVNYGNSRLAEVGILEKGKFITSENNSEVYNNIIELELE